MSKDKVKNKLGNLPIFGVSRFYSTRAKAKQRFEREMLELNNVLGENVETNERVIELIEWYRKECGKRPEIYSGDEIVVNIMKRAAMTGLNFNFILMETYRILKANFAFTDNTRAMG